MMQAVRSVTPRASVFLHPGQMVATAEPSEVTTILGSCVAVCLHDAGARIGGVNHYLLPHSAEGPRFPARFGSIAIDRLIERMMECGADPDRLQAKVFGGAAVVGTSRSPGTSLGGQNVAVAFEILEKRRIRVVAQETGGSRGRKLICHTDEGTVWVRTL